MKLFDVLGFRWDRSKLPTYVPTDSVERACFRFHKNLAGFVWDASMLEGNPFTFPEVQTLLDGITVGGKKISDQEQVLNLSEASRRLNKMVLDRQFQLEKNQFLEINGIVARNEALEWGVFRGEGNQLSFTPSVNLGEYGEYTPKQTVFGAPELNATFNLGVSLLKSEVQSHFERATAFFLFGALQQFFFDGNKRTSRFMMNGILMSNGIDAISVPAARRVEFNEKMVGFYRSRDASEMMSFLVDCHPESKMIYGMNPDLRIHPPLDPSAEQKDAADLSPSP